MHELSIVEAVLEQAEREIRRAGQEGPVRRLELSIGHLAGVNCDSLRFAFELLSPESAFAGAELQIRQPAAVCRCRGCGAQCEVKELIAECPKCGSFEVSLEGGREMFLESIELAD
jgi:hydrogenase nickel incorporation protein HypA/HybF